MILPLLSNEWRALLRDGRGRTILALGLLLAIGSAWIAASIDHRERRGQAAAAEGARTAWLEREGDNPHSRAHYGDFVFRPSGPLAGLDSGLQMVTGRSIHLEAHRQNAAVHIPSRGASALLRFDRLEPATVLHLLVPLVLLLTGFGTVAAERESGRLRLLLTQGARPLSILFGKAVALWSVGAVLAFLLVGTHLAFSAQAAAPGPTALFLLLQLATLWIVSAVVTCVSSQVRRPGTAAGILLSLWFVCAIFLPRFATMTAKAALPLPTRDAFEAAMREDREKGLNGHNPSDERSLEVEREILEQYGVATKEELPVNLDGFLMQADEEYGNRVWDKHFGALEEHLRRQSSLVGLFSFVDPLVATERISMAIARTDLESHLYFLGQVEAHRRTLVRMLNEEHALGGSKTGDWSWTADQEFYASFDAFAFEPLPYRRALASTVVEGAALAAWVALATGLLFLGARRLERGGSL